MAKVVYNELVKEVHGAMAKHGNVNRRKVYRDEKGRVIYEAHPETYKIMHPRDWKKKPPQGEELKKIQRFSKACALTKAILNNADPNSLNASISLDTIESYKQRFNRQLGKKADPQAPKDPKTGKLKHYHRLDNFVRALILQQLKTAE